MCEWETKKKIAKGSMLAIFLTDNVEWKMLKCVLECVVIQKHPLQYMANQHENYYVLVKSCDSTFDKLCT